MSWGHATSPDLATSVEQPVALRHDGSEAIYSGSVVVDHSNTSGFGDPGDDAPPRAGSSPSPRRCSYRHR